MGWQFPHCIWYKTEDHEHKPDLSPDTPWPDLSGSFYWGCRVLTPVPLYQCWSPVQYDPEMLSLFSIPGWSFHEAVDKASLSSMQGEFSYEPANWAGFQWVTSLICSEPATTEKPGQKTLRPRLWDNLESLEDFTEVYLTDYSCILGNKILAMGWLDLQ